MYQDRTFSVLTTTVIVLAMWFYAGLGRWNATDGAHANLGAEYNAIAYSIYQGNGFSSPFHVDSGPTAWMPPTIPACIAAIYFASDGDCQLVVETVRILQAIAVAYCCVPFRICDLLWQDSRRGGDAIGDWDRRSL